jgi:hypothetical protein
MHHVSSSSCVALTKNNVILYLSYANMMICVITQKSFKGPLWPSILEWHLNYLRFCPHKFEVYIVYFMLVINVGHEIKSNPLKFGSQVWIWNLISILDHLGQALRWRFRSNLRTIIKMKFWNNLIQVMVPFLKSKCEIKMVSWFVWVWSLINSQLINNSI